MCKVIGKFENLIRKNNILLCRRRRKKTISIHYDIYIISPSSSSFTQRADAPSLSSVHHRRLYFAALHRRWLSHARRVRSAAPSSARNTQLLCFRRAAAGLLCSVSWVLPSALGFAGNLSFG